MNATQRGTYWLKVERLRRSLDKKYSSLFSDILISEFRQFANDVKRIGASAALSKMGSLAWDDKLMTQMRKLYKEIAVTFGNASYRAVSVESKKAADPFEINEDLLDEMISFLVQYGFFLVSLMTQTTKKKLYMIVVNAQSEGKTNEEIAKIIMSDETLAYLRMRGERIARTEVARSSNFATVKGAEKHNFVVDKIWIATRDARTRRIPRDYYDHWDMDGKIVALDEYFTSADKVGRPVVAAFPGDPNAPKGFTINCRCAVAFIPRRDANGRLIMK